MKVLHTVILSHIGTRMKTLLPIGDKFAGGCVLELRTEGGLGQIELNETELERLLLQLPTSLLMHVLEARGFTFDRLEPDNAGIEEGVYVPLIQPVTERAQ